MKNMKKMIRLSKIPFAVGGPDRDENNAPLEYHAPPPGRDENNAPVEYRAPPTVPKANPTSLPAGTAPTANPTPLPAPTVSAPPSPPPAPPPAPAPTAADTASASLPTPPGTARLLWLLPAAAAFAIAGISLIAAGMKKGPK